MRTRTPNIRIVIVAFTLMASLASAVGIARSPALAAESDEIVFEGAGFGHGRGMSQYGAQARALAGQSMDEVLLFYYGDTSTGTQRTQIAELGVGETSAPRNVFTNVRSDTGATTLTVSDGGGTGTQMIISRVAGPPGDTPVELSAGDKVVITDNGYHESSSNDCVAVLTVSGATVEWGLGSCDFDITLHAGEGLPEEVVTATDCRTSHCTFGYGEMLHLVDNGSSQRTVPDWIAGPNSTVYAGFDIVVEASLDDYTRGIAEVPFSWEPVALQSQAVAARSYAASWVASTDYLSEGCFCDLKNDTTRQVYAGWIGDKLKWENWDTAALATSGLVLMHPEAPTAGFIRTEYSSSNGGTTEQAYEFAGNENPFPYMSPKNDPYSLTGINPYASWTVSIPRSTIENAFNWPSGTLHSVEISQATFSGRAEAIRFTSTGGGTRVVSPGTLASIISSTATCINDDGNPCGSSAHPFPSWFFDVPAPPPAPAFTDIGDTIHQADIEYLAALGVVLACDAGLDRFCPDDRMRREDLAAFMVRALDLPATSVDYFKDDNGLPHEADINALAEAGITKGCNPPANDNFCPDSTVSRGQTAAFIVRAWQLKDAGAGDRFVDDDASIFEGDIDRLAQAGITKGCNPPENTNYCPTRLLTRAEMSSFLARALRSL